MPITSLQFQAYYHVSDTRPAPDAHEESQRMLYLQGAEDQGEKLA